MSEHISYLLVFSSLLEALIKHLQSLLAHQQRLLLSTKTVCYTIK